jgi:segregation and condensation protein A
VRLRVPQPAEGAGQIAAIRPRDREEMPRTMEHPFNVDLSVFRGPLDLLLYLVRKHEVEIVDIPIARITDQYLEYMAVLKERDVGEVGEFLAMASLLVEIKSQQVLPRADEVEEEIDDPRQELVRRLLEYKQYRDAASILDERGRDWQQHFPRLGSDLPPRQRNLAEEPIHEVELWDLVSAFGRIIRENVAVQPSNIVYDETPIHVYMSRILALMQQRGRLRLGELLDSRLHKSALVGMFLAVLELVRHHRVRAEQNELFGEIWLLAGEENTVPLDPAEVDNYEHGRAGAGAEAPADSSPS